ncbi:glutaminase A [Brevibacterium salitolerans]|uniref:Glutaminase n=1 Tax=Brevibacterium salitolerans TaxID=1403566 RepID=A0ABN2WYL9_9MICO
MRSPVQTYLSGLHARVRAADPFAAHPTPGFRTASAGSPAEGLSVLYGGDPDHLGIAMTTADGFSYRVGDACEEFSIQSISKVFVYALALMDSGFDLVDGKIDVEPSGSAYNDLSSEAGSGRPKNALINIGAIAATSLVRPVGEETAFERILAVFSACAGRQLSLDEEVLRADYETGAHNRGLAWFLSSWGIIEGDPNPAFDDYTKQCAISVTAADLSMMAATLAHLGVNPATGERVFPEDVVERVLSVMLTCGMYDDSGDWVTTVGLPAKSGVGGGIIAVLPGQLGIATYSPPLDRHGNSAKGIVAHEEMSADLGLHIVRAGKPGRAVIRSHTTVDRDHSSLRRSPEDEAVLEEHGDRAHILELIGDVHFSGFEAVSRLIEELDEPQVVVLDIGKVDELSGSALMSLARLAATMDEEGIAVGVVDPDALLRRHELKRALLREAAEAGVVDGAVEAAPTDGAEGQSRLPVRIFASRHAALVWAEDAVLLSEEDAGAQPVRQQGPVLGGLSPAVRAVVRGLLTAETAEEGQVIRAPGDDFDGIRFVVSGEVHSVSPDGELMAVLRAGATFGEYALGTGAGQPFAVIAAQRSRFELLSAEALERMEAESPAAAAALWRSIAHDGYARLVQAVRGEERTE